MMVIIINDYYILPWLSPLAPYSPDKSRIIFEYNFGIILWIIQGLLF